MMPVDAGYTPFSPTADDAVHVVAIGPVGEIDDGAADVSEFAARLAQQLVDIAHRLFGLSARVPYPDRIAVEIASDLPPDEDHVAGTHHLAEVVVQVLIGIGVLGIEFAKPVVSHRIHLSRHGLRHPGPNRRSRRVLCARFPAPVPVPTIVQHVRRTHGISCRLRSAVKPPAAAEGTRHPAPQASRPKKAVATRVLLSASCRGVSPRNCATRSTMWGR